MTTRSHCAATRMHDERSAPTTAATITVMGPTQANVAKNVTAKPITNSAMANR